ncbi:DUF2339 domain-containing protein [Enemella sp. A6]|uniref:DUF2339 domain-containing protein n=1 Tax=Enemella sp. A6 TaxID=3440152 RepID=UPI003EB7A424
MDDTDRLAERLEALAQQQSALADRIGELQEQVTRLQARLDADHDTNPTRRVGQPGPHIAQSLPHPAHSPPHPAQAPPAQSPVARQPAPRPAVSGPGAAPPHGHWQPPHGPPPASTPLGAAVPAHWQGSDVAAYDLPTMSRRPPRADLAPIPSAGDDPDATRPSIAPEPARQNVIAKVLAFVGSGVLLIGIGLLLVLAAQAGFFGPVAQVVTVAVAAVALLAAAIWLRRRSPVGAIALAAVAFAAGYLDMAAITALHGWLPRPAGLVAAGIIALGGLVLARWWLSGALATIVSLGVLVLVPLVSPDPTTTLAFGLAFALVSLLATWGLGWVGAQIARLIPLTLVAAAAALTVPLSDPDFPLLVAAGVILVVLGLVEGVAAKFRPTRDPDASDDPVASLLPATAAVCLGLLVVPSLIVGIRLEDHGGPILLIAVAVGLLVVAGTRLAPTGTRAVAAGVGSLWLPIGATAWLPTEWLPAPFLVTSLLLIAIAWLTKSALFGWAAGVHATVMIAGQMLFLLPLFDRSAALEAFPFQPLQSLLAAITLVLLRETVLRLHRRAAKVAHRNRHVVNVVAGAMALVLLSPAVVSVSTWLGDRIGDAEAGYRVGHGVVTIGWFLAAGVALLLGLRRTAGGGTRRGFGLTVAAAALMKFLLWDLSVLSGLVRVVVAIVTGLLLIGLGMWYARALDRAGRDATPESQVSPEPPAPPPSWHG